MEAPASSSNPRVIQQVLNARGVQEQKVCVCERKRKQLDVVGPRMNEIDPWPISCAILPCNTSILKAEILHEPHELLACGELQQA